MKYKTVVRQVADTYTRDGKTIPITRDEEVRVPKFPRNWQLIALRGAVTTVLLLTLVTVAWSTYSIGSLLGGGFIGFAAAVIFDLGWAVALILEYLARNDRSKRAFPKRLGWGLLAVTMGAILWHGLLDGHVEMGVIGAFVSAFAKLLWLGVMKYVNADLTPEDEQWVAHEMSAARAKLAVASVRRQAARAEMIARQELLAVERELGGSDPEPAGDSTPEIAPPTLADMGKADAIRYVHRAMPDAETAEIARTLAVHGVEVDPGYVSQTLTRSRKQFEPSNVINLGK